MPQTKTQSRATLLALPVATNENAGDGRAVTNTTRPAPAPTTGRAVRTAAGWTVWTLEATAACERFEDVDKLLNVGWLAT